jgi:MipA family protein
MKKLLVLTLAGACNVATAQTPANNPMPDGSRDMYLGLGVLSAPEYEGGRERQVSAVPLLQAEWSNGIFVSGVSVGMHLSGSPKVEFGPLLTYQGRRDETGTSKGPDGVSGGLGGPAFPSSALPPPEVNKPPTEPGFGTASGDVSVRTDGNRLAGIRPLKARLLGGGFFNYYVAPSVRLTSTALAGAGRDGDGALLTLGLQSISNNVGAHHAVSVSAGLTLVNASYNRSYFGVTAKEAVTSHNRAYTPGGGLKDVHLGVRWNWTLAPSWLISSSARVSHLQGDAKQSPLVERPTNFTVSTGLAYRF